VTCLASVNYAGRTSVEVGIKIFAEDLSTGKKRHTNSCYFTMVCLSLDGRPAPVPVLVPETEDEKRRARDGEERRRLSRERLKKNT
jgi:acyl-CoA hydrolase